MRRGLSIGDHAFCTQAGGTTLAGGTIARSVEIGTGSKGSPADGGTSSGAIGCVKWRRAAAEVRGNAAGKGIPGTGEEGMLSGGTIPAGGGSVGCNATVGDVDWLGGGEGDDGRAGDGPMCSTSPW